ncbi:Tyrosine-protein phosphatase non-receptor type 23 [Bagarius yarrelli]|uniref:Tyrosine-protein phosphatase non-receptor type 23 n=1 Tax=Bagarius yarrelli TaxID=175774 RepID=A0A556VU19_BAGYA|nr:Tyrosine-protein phosphatase non-receptor type 23 [Bagarius yarrelli]
MKSCTTCSFTFTQRAEEERRHSSVRCTLSAWTVCRCHGQNVRDTVLPHHLQKNRNPPFPTYFADGDEELPEDLYADEMFQCGEPLPESRPNAVHTLAWTWTTIPTSAKTPPYDVNRKSGSAEVRRYIKRSYGENPENYSEALRTLEKLRQLHLGKHSEEQKKNGEAGQPESVQEALRFSMDVIGGKFNSAKKDNDFIYHELVPGLDTLAVVKGASLVKPLPVSTTDPNTTGPDLFSKLVPLAAHEASSVYRSLKEDVLFLSRCFPWSSVNVLSSCFSEEKAKLLREVMAKIDEKNRSLESFMDSLNCDSVDLDMFSSVPSALLEKCAALSVQPDAVKRLVQAMQGVFVWRYTDVGSYLEEVCNELEKYEAEEQTLLNVLGQKELPPSPAELTELRKEFRKYETAHQVASQTNTELHKAMNQHIPNLRLLQGPLEELRNSLPQLQLTEDDTSSLQTMKRICGKVDEMRKQRLLFEKELRDLIQKDDITTILVTTGRADRKALIEEQLQKYGQLKGYIDQNLAAQKNIIKALTDAGVKCASVRKTLSVTKEQWNSSVQSMVASYKAYEDLVKKAEEGRSFYQDLEKKTSNLLDKVKTICQNREEVRKTLTQRLVAQVPPPRPTARKPVPASGLPGLQSHTSSAEASVSSSAGHDVPQKLNSLPPNMALAKGPPLPNFIASGPTPFNWPAGAAGPQFLNQGMPQLMPFNHGQVSGVPHSMAPIQQFPHGPPGGILPVLPQNYPQTLSQIPYQGYMPALWQKSPGVPMPNDSANYTSQPEIEQNAARPDGNVLMCGGQGQQMKPSMSHYQGFPPQPAHGIITCQNQPSSHPDQIQPQNSTGRFLSSIASSQPQPMPRSIQNVNKPTQVSLGHNQPMGNLYIQGGTHSQVQPHSAPNPCQQPSAQLRPMFQPGNPFHNHPVPPQSNCTSGPGPASVMDNPNPAALTAILTPSPAQPNASVLKPSSAENSVSVLQDKVEQLSITSQPDCGEDKGK